MAEITKRARINWDAVQAIGVILTVFSTWFIGRYQAQTQLEIVSEQLRAERSGRYAENRRMRRPILAFDRMSFTVPVETCSDGMRRFDFPRDNNGGILDDSEIPSIKNYGAGPALHIGVSYENKTPQPSNSVTVPLHCLPGESVKYFSIPASINDPKNPVSTAKGTARIVCEDTTGERHFIEQEYFVNVQDNGLYFNFQEIQRAFSLSSFNGPLGLREDY